MGISMQSNNRMHVSQYMQFHQEQPPSKKRKLPDPSDVSDEVPITESSTHAAVSAWELMHQTRTHMHYDEHFCLLQSWERGWKRVPRYAPTRDENMVTPGMI